MPSIPEIEAVEHKCPWNGFTQCFGSECMAWVWNGAPYEDAETHNIVKTEDGERPVGDPPEPEGADWKPEGAPVPKGYHRSDKDNLPKGSMQRWRRKRERLFGSCGRVSDNDYPW